MARRSRRDAPEPQDYIPEEDDFEEDEEPRRRKRRSRDEDEDDEEEERPRRRRSRRDEEDDEDEEPRRRKRRPRDDEEDDEDEDDEPPRRRRRRAEEDDEDEEPRRRKRRPRDDDDDDEDDDEDDEDDEPRAKKGKKRKSNRTSGWSAYDNVKSSTSNFADRLAVGKIEGEELIKFLDEEPFGAFGLHWFDNLDGKKGWMCLISIGEEKCPGCAIGDRANPNALFNVLVLDDDGDWNLKVLQAGTRMTGQIKGLAEGKGGLTTHYWSVSAGPKGSGTGNFQKVKERDLEEDWDVDPLTDRELDEWEEDLHVLQDVEQVPSYKDFKEAVRDLED